MKKLWLWLIVAVTIFLALGFLHHPVTKKFTKPTISQGGNNIPTERDYGRELQKESKTPTKTINLSNLPKIVHHNFIELNKISKISKFRSGYGHDFSSGDNETNSCRSMKHYLMIKGLDDEFWSRYHKGKITKRDWPVVKYFAPVSGIIIDMHSSKNMFGEEEKQFILKPNKYPNILFGFFHVIIQKNITIGSEIYPGEFLGTISAGNDGEIAVTINPNSNNQLVSFFRLTDDKVFSDYQKRGITSKKELIISEKERNKNPLICENNWEKRFIGSKKIPNDKNAYDSWSMSKDNWVFLK